MITVRRIIWSCALLTIGWVVGHAQRAEPDFMLSIDAPFGETRVKCVSGCALMGSNDLGNPNAGTMLEFLYACRGRAAANPDARCGATVAGWLRE
jgi:hypothetical protein